MNNTNWNGLRLLVAIVFIAYGVILGYNTNIDEVKSIVPMILFCTGIISILTIKFDK